MILQPGQTSDIAIDAEVVKVALNTPTQGDVLIGNRLVPMALTPVIDGSDRPVESARARLALGGPVPLTVTPPVPSKAQEIEGVPPFALLLNGRPPTPLLPRSVLRFPLRPTYPKSEGLF